MHRAVQRSRACLFTALLLLAGASAHRITLRLPHDSGDDDGPDYEVLPYQEPALSAALLVEQQHARIVPAGCTFNGCQADDRPCVTEAVTRRIVAKRHEALGPPDSSETIITLAFTDYDHDLRMTLTIRKGDTALTAAARFCREEVAGPGRSAAPTCVSQVEALAFGALADHGFLWRDPDGSRALAEPIPKGAAPVATAHRPRLQWLKQHVGCPRRALDVGACFGAWTRLLREVCPDAEVTMVEVNPARHELLADTAADLNAGPGGRVRAAPPTLLGARDDPAVPFYQTKLSRGGTGDSMFRELSNFYASPEAMDVVLYPMRSLDSLAASDPAAFGAVDLVKLDVQGAELEVLGGALAQLASSVELVLLEAPLRAFNEGAPDLATYLAFMKRQGFSVIDVYEVHHLEQAGTSTAHPAALQVDLLFARDNLRALAEKPAYQFDTGL